MFKRCFKSGLEGPQIIKPNLTAHLSYNKGRPTSHVHNPRKKAKQFQEIMYVVHTIKLVIRD